VFPGFDGGAEWGGAAFDPDSALLFVNSNEMPWIVRLIPNNDTSLYKVNCATCHRDDRKGSPSAPSLERIGDRRRREEIAARIRQEEGEAALGDDASGRRQRNAVHLHDLRQAVRRHRLRGRKERSSERQLSGSVRVTMTLG